MLMISSHEGKEGIENLIDPFILKDEKITRFRVSKPIVIITARVHPLETPSSLCMNGIIEFLTNTTDARAYFLRKYFVFMLVPMLNPDGVSRGHCRMDSLNQNLNRYYKTPTIEYQPSCYAIRKLVEHYSKDKRVFFYLDLHAHPANKGNFVFGNAIFDFVLQV
jgi:murein tripeptide amidase MpaA